MRQSSLTISSFSLSLCYLVWFLSSSGFARSLRDGNTTGIVKIGQYVPLEGICTAYIKEILADVTMQELVCFTSNGKIFAVPSADQEWIDEKQRTGELISGETILDLPPNTMVDMETFSIDLAYPPNLLNTVDEESQNRRRQLRRLAVTGTHTVLAIRVIASDASASLTEADISDGIFGTIDDPANLVTQYKACSYGKLQFKPTNDKKGKTRNIKDGATTIKIDIPTKQGDAKIMEAVNAKLVTEFGTSQAKDLADHIMYCLPPGTLTEKQLAFAFVNGYQIWFNDVNCGYLTVQMHEMGHNLGMGHSGEDGNEYGDTSGLVSNEGHQYAMASSAKSWQLGWYEDKAVTVTPKAGDASFSVKLAGIVDYDTTDANVLIRIVPDTLDTHYYMNYNAAKGMNKASTEGRDQVLVTKKDITYEKNVSWRIAELDATNTFKLNDFNGKKGETLTITVNSIVDDVADISIVLSGFPDAPAPTTPPVTPPPTKTPDAPAPTTTPDAPAPTTPPTKAPTPAPTKPPTPAPTKPPTPAPTKPPTSKPTPSPTVSVNPTSSPTANPSLAPSVATSAPTAPPTIAPSASPTQLTPAQRSATVPLAVDVTGLDRLDVICKGAEGLIDQEVKNAFGSDTQTSVSCSQDVNDIRRKLFLDYEKQVVATVTTTFARGHEAPRQFRFSQYLNRVMASEEASAALPGFIEKAATDSGSGFDTGIYTSLDTTRNPPVVVINFSAETPSASPTSASEPNPATNPTQPGSDGPTFFGSVWFMTVLAVGTGLLAAS
eukprot:scaffold695_cov113-Cylindrotheca_fusiformis.AAC.1